MIKLWIFGLVFYTTSVFASNINNDATISVYCKTKEYNNYYTPWSLPTIQNYRGSGCIIEGNIILTNAHVVANASFIEIKSSDSNDRYEAFVKYIDHNCDLAVLEVVDCSFYEGKHPFTISNKMAIQKEEVQVYGFPMGGNGLSVTQGIVSRIEMDIYSHASSYFLITQIDAPINPGNSGGPVISNGQIVGIAHQGYKEGQNIGYMIPVPVIQHFLKEVKEGQYHGFPTNSLKMQLIQNDSMKEYYGLEKDMGGLLITYIPENYFLHGVLQPKDILLSIDGQSIDQNGYIQYDNALGLHLPTSYAFIMKYFDEWLEFEVLRSGEVLNISSQIDLNKNGKQLVPIVEYDKVPTYYIFGGLVFQPLSGNFFDKNDWDWNDMLVSDFLYYYHHGKVHDGCDEIIVLSHVLADLVNVGYQNLKNEIVKEVNGNRIKNMKDMVKAFEDFKGEYHVIMTDNDSEIILSHEQIIKRTPTIFHRYFISSDRSMDLKDKL